MPSDTPAKTRILLVRHADRYDYANRDVWRSRCERHGLELTDPPLSSLGHEQARATAHALKELRPDLILCSPYLRVLQTAQPLAHVCSLDLCVDDALAEFRHDPAKMPPLAARLAVFPEVHDAYEPMMRLTVPGSESAEDYFRRMLLLARELPRRHPGQTVALFSHAASVALVAALTESAVCAAGTFAPCGIYCLATEDGGATWQLELTGDTNQPHVTRNSPTTYAWGFQHSRTAALIEEVWATAKQRGPASSLGAGTSAATPESSPEPAAVQ